MPVFFRCCNLCRLCIFIRGKMPVNYYSAVRLLLYLIAQRVNSEQRVERNRRTPRSYGGEPLLSAGLREGIVSTRSQQGRWAFSMFFREC